MSTTKLVRRIALAELRTIVTDPSELTKGTKIFDEGCIAHLSRFENKLFADAKGSGPAPYKTQIVFEGKTVRGRCSCMAARSRPFCKHAAALLVAWARAPETFAEAPAAPVEAQSGAAARRRELKKGNVDPKALMQKGVEQVSTLVRELAVSGVASMAADRVEQVRALGEALREHRLRRISARTLELSHHLARAASRTEAFDANAYAELVADLLLTARKLEKHFAGEPLADEHVEELIGKTWTKKDRKPTSGHDLVEYAFFARVTPDEFVIRESRFVDVVSGEHFSEKQILPGFLAKRTTLKKSFAGRILMGVTGSLYPTYAPKRIDIDEVSIERDLMPADLERLLERALPDAATALAALQERRKDVFAPETLPALVRVDTLLAGGARLRVVDASDASLFLPEDDELEDALARVLARARLEALVGDVALDGALPTFFPLAAIVRSSGDRLSLSPMSLVDAATLLASSKKVRADLAPSTRTATSRWVDVARAVGASNAAIALGEIREEMAQALATGLPSVNRRFVEPLATKLRELGLGRQGDLLVSIAERSDPADRLDDLVKLHQVLAIALARIAGAVHVDRAELEAVPSYECVYVKRPERVLSSREIVQARLSRWEAAFHYARQYESMSPDELARSIYPTWADGSASAHVARVLSRAPELGVATAKCVLGLDREQSGDRRFAYAWHGASARVAKLTAIRVLETIGNEEAKRVLARFAGAQPEDAALSARARRALAALSGTPLPSSHEQELRELTSGVLDASNKLDRIRALGQLAAKGFVEAIPVIRASFAGDISMDVREAAAYALARLGDVDSVDTFVRMLRARETNPPAARIGASALGILGDARGIGELLEAFADGWQPVVIANAIRVIGVAALEPLVAFAEERPDVADRKGTANIIAALPEDDVATMLLAKLESLVREAPPDAELCTRAALYVTLAGAHPLAASRLVRRILELYPGLLDEKKKSGAERILARKCAKHVA